MNSYNIFLKKKLYQKMSYIKAPYTRRRRVLAPPCSPHRRGGLTGEVAMLAKRLSNTSEEKLAAWEYLVLKVLGVCVTM